MNYDIVCSKYNFNICYNKSNKYNLSIYYQIILKEFIFSNFIY